MMLLYPTRGSIDAWETLGNEGWGYESLAPYFHKFATVHTPPQAAKDALGLASHDDLLAGDGPVQLSYSEGYGRNNSAWMETFAKFGLTMKNNVNMRGENELGAFQQLGTIDPATKTRSYAGTAHYTPEIAKRPNLTVLTGTVVKKIICDTTGPTPVTTGVLALSKDGTESVINSSEVILSAGALMSPQILELSGIGSKSLLESLGIPVIIDNPSVGEHLQDHPVTCQSFEVNEGIISSDVLRDPAILNTLVQQYQATREGPLGQSNITVTYAPLSDESGVWSAEMKKKFFNSFDQLSQTTDGQIVRSLLEANEPTVQYYLFPGQANTVAVDPTNMAQYLIPAKPENCITVMTLLNHPFSRGSVHISSTDVRQLPTWDPNFNSNALDLEVGAHHVKFVERFIATPPFSDILKPDGLRIPNIKAESLEEAREIVRQSQVSNFHPCGSCTMRPKEKGGVVDSRLRVHGVKGLRVVDASIFPLVTVGNIQATVYAVAEKAADLIKADRAKV